MGDCGGLWRGVEGCGGVWRVGEDLAGLWRVVEGCRGVGSLVWLDTYLRPIGPPGCSASGYLPLPLHHSVPYLAVVVSLSLQNLSYTTCFAGRHPRPTLGHSSRPAPLMTHRPGCLRPPAMLRFNHCRHSNDKHIGTLSSACTQRKAREETRVLDRLWTFLSPAYVLSL